MKLPYRTIVTIVLFPLAAMLSVARASEDQPPAGKKYIYKQSGGRPREMEVYFPENHDSAKTAVPGILLFHGGGWTGGSLSQFRVACHYFAQRGLVAATANYRMLNREESAKLPEGESHKRVCITDAKSAIRWMKEHAAELGIDPKRIITGGGSAGGHIAVLATTNAGLNDPADSPGIDTTVVAYLLFNPAFSPSDRHDTEVDVFRHLEADFAPAIALFGTNDAWKPGWNAVRKRLAQLGSTTTESWLAEGQAHGFFNRQPWRDVTLAAADRFLAQHGLLEGECLIPAPPGGDRPILEGPAAGAR